MLENITKTTLLVDKDIAIRNIIKMKDKAENAGAVFRPHFKTHQSGLIGEWYRNLGIEKITVSSVAMAQYFALHGWRDITLAFPVNLREISSINEIIKSTKINLLIESIEVADKLEASLSQSVDVFIKIDCGAHRAGISIDNPNEILSLANHISKKKHLHLSGFLTHAGQTYLTTSPVEIADIASTTAHKLQKLKVVLNDPELVLSWGDTPSCSMIEGLKDFDEWRPGNFVFYDVMQFHIGSCGLDDVAVAMACPVVAMHQKRNQLVIYGGAIHFSKEHIVADNGFRLFGYVVPLTDNGWGQPISGAWLSSISQEHGVVQLPPHTTELFHPGDLIGILPVHSCLTISAMQEMISLSGEFIPCMK
ncbi:MAG: alanine racemase [Bacteroidetes bacterium HGW-Bacteroidetes-1]|jgi:D-serine deaminase-like pyridoxal phosphate-dependent protein|nr:MAG: alanine racemase [Bacteroidetes bacterium HGW-Bacteroidetes-1]